MGLSLHLGLAMVRPPGLHVDKALTCHLLGRPIPPPPLILPSKHVATTQDSAVFNFFPGGAPARGLDSLSYRYRELAPFIKLAGPTSFAPAIYQAGDDSVLKAHPSRLSLAI